MSDSENIVIDLEVAREIARASCETLSEYFLEAEHCWIFFNEHPGDFAIAVSRSGKIRYVYDLRDNPQMMQDYLMMFSAHCSGDKPRTEKMLSEFMRRYYENGRDQPFKNDAQPRTD